MVNIYTSTGAHIKLGSPTDSNRSIWEIAKTLRKVADSLDKLVEAEAKVAVDNPEA
jgi:hypothetical protein